MEGDIPAWEPSDQLSQAEQLNIDAKFDKVLDDFDCLQSLTACLEDRLSRLASEIVSPVAEKCTNQLDTGAIVGAANANTNTKLDVFTDQLELLGSGLHSLESIVHSMQERIASLDASLELLVSTKPETTKGQKKPNA